MNEKVIKAVVSITPEEKQEIMKLARDNGIRLSKWYSEAIKEKLERDREKA